MGGIRKPRNESDKATLARVTKEMALPRIAKSARKWARTRQDSQWGVKTVSRHSYLDSLSRIGTKSSGRSHTDVTPDIVIQDRLNDFITVI